MDVSVRGEEPGTGGTVVCGPAKVPEFKHARQNNQTVCACRLKKRSDCLLLSMKKTQLSFVEYGKGLIVCYWVWILLLLSFIEYGKDPILFYMEKVNWAWIRSDCLLTFYWVWKRPDCLLLSLEKIVFYWVWKRSDCLLMFYWAWKRSYCCLLSRQL